VRGVVPLTSFTPTPSSSRDRGGRDHAAVGDDAYPADVKALAQTVNDRQQHNGVARDKLDGKNADVLLTEARKNDCEYRSTSEKTP
jgi:hypothetical protein